MYNTIGVETLPEKQTISMIHDRFCAVSKINLLQLSSASGMFLFQPQFLQVLKKVFIEK